MQPPSLPASERISSPERRDARDLLGVATHVEEHLRAIEQRVCKLVHNHESERPCAFMIVQVRSQP